MVMFSILFELYLYSWQLHTIAVLSHFQCVSGSSLFIFSKMQIIFIKLLARAPGYRWSLNIYHCCSMSGTSVHQHRHQTL